MSIFTAPERATQIWAVLGLAARNRQILTYRMVGKLIGVPARGLGHLLEPIQSYCLEENLPPLTILVVQEETGLPGSGFSAATAAEFAKRQLQVFDYDWIERGAPTPEQLEIAVKKRPSRPGRETEGGPPTDDQT
jgi:alkylated DNA nucleotide flippase Atl1